MIELYTYIKESVFDEEGQMGEIAKFMNNICYIYS